MFFIKIFKKFIVISAARVSEVPAATELRREPSESSTKSSSGSSVRGAFKDPLLRPLVSDPLPVEVRPQQQKVVEKPEVAQPPVLDVRGDEPPEQEPPPVSPGSPDSAKSFSTLRSRPSSEAKRKNSNLISVTSVETETAAVPIVTVENSNGQHGDAATIVSVVRICLKKIFYSFFFIWLLYMWEITYRVETS